MSCDSTAWSQCLDIRRALSWTLPFAFALPREGLADVYLLNAQKSLLDHIYVTSAAISSDFQKPDPLPVRPAPTLAISILPPQTKSVLSNIKDRTPLQLCEVPRSAYLTMAPRQPSENDPEEIDPRDAYCKLLL